MVDFSVFLRKVNVSAYIQLDNSYVCEVARRNKELSAPPYLYKLVNMWEENNLMTAKKRKNNRRVSKIYITLKGRKIRDQLCKILETNKFINTRINENGNINQLEEVRKI